MSVAGIIHSSPISLVESFPNRPGMEPYPIFADKEPAGVKCLEAFVLHLISPSSPTLGQIYLISYLMLSVSMLKNNIKQYTFL